MDTNEDEPEPAGVVPGAVETEAEAPGPGLLRSSWRGAKTGFRFVSYIVGPIAGVMMLFGNALTAFGLGAGRGWGESKIASEAFLFYLACAAYGAAFGAGFGLVGAVIRRVWPAAFWGAVWSALHRPIYLGRRRPAPDAAPPRRRWLRIVRILMLVVLAIAFGTGTYLWRVVDRRLADAIAAADRDDPYWRLDDLMAHREPVPDEENAAFIVVEVLSLGPENWLGEFKPVTGPRTPPPTELMNALERISARADNVRLDDSVADTLRDELKMYDAAVKVARTAADYPRGRHELELGPILIDTLLPESQSTRTVARLLIADATIRAHDGDADGALDSCRANLCTARSIGDEPFMVSQSIRMAIGSVAMKSARRVLAQREPSDAALARLQALILDELSQPTLLRGIRGERATLTELIRRFGTGEVPISALGKDGPKFAPGDPGTAIAPWSKVWFDQQLAVTLEWMNAAVAIAGRPVAERSQLWQALDAEIGRVKLSQFGLYTATLPLFLMPVLDGAISSHSRCQCELGATAILLAAERHRRKAGEWPASIAAIDPSILPSAPVDPFSGQAFRFERRDGQLFIYSIGPNREDEHGAYEPRQWPTGGPDDAGAVGWDVPLRRQPPPPEDKPVRSRSSP